MPQSSFKTEADRAHAREELISSRFAPRTKKVSHKTVAAKYHVSVDTIDREASAINKMTLEDTIRFLHARGLTIQQITNTVHKNRVAVSNVIGPHINKPVVPSEYFHLSISGDEQSERFIYQAMQPGHKVRSREPGAEESEGKSRPLGKADQIFAREGMVSGGQGAMQSALQPERGYVFVTGPEGDKMLVKLGKDKKPEAPSQKNVEAMIKHWMANGVEEFTTDNQGNLVGPSIIKGLKDSGVRYPRAAFKKVIGRYPQQVKNVKVVQGVGGMPIAKQISSVFPEGTVSKEGVRPVSAEIMAQARHVPLPGQRVILGEIGNRANKIRETLEPKNREDEDKIVAKLTAEDATIMRIFLKNYKNQPDAIGMVAQAYNIGTDRVRAHLKKYPRNVVSNRIERVLQQAEKDSHRFHGTAAGGAIVSPIETRGKMYEAAYGAQAEEPRNVFPDYPPSPKLVRMPSGKLLVKEPDGKLVEPKGRVRLRGRKLVAR